MKVKTLIELPMPLRLIRQGREPFHKIGTTISHPKAFRLVQLGVAVPADKECEDKVRTILPMMDRLIFLGKRSERGIHMDDFKAYEDGLMTGYKPDGTHGDSWQHGPNWTEGCEADYYSGQEDDDDE